ncbi:MAG TPA: hypothetical protein P5295_16100 [Spirochaetota bacterium]|nr:hypothetical protein [Spirochaetota bacterium]
MKALLFVAFLFAFTVPGFSFGKYLEWYMVTWTYQDQVDYILDPEAMADYVMYLDETEWNLC